MTTDRVQVYKSEGRYYARTYRDGTAQTSRQTAVRGFATREKAMAWGVKRVEIEDRQRAEAAEVWS